MLLTCETGFANSNLGTKNLRKSTSYLGQKLRLVWIPQLEPFLFTALRTGLSLTWKIILVVELLGRSSGIRFQIHLYFQLLGRYDPRIRMSFMMVMQLVNSAVRPLEQHVQRWRKDGQLV